MKSLCLENYGVYDLETREMKTIDGGIAPVVVFFVIAFFADTQSAR